MDGVEREEGGAGKRRMIKSSDSFQLRIDASFCTSMIEGTEFFQKEKACDCWRYENLQFESGKIYGLVGEYGLGCMYLSYLLGGKIEFSDLKIYLNEREISRQDLKKISWNLEPFKESYRNAVVKKVVEKAIRKGEWKDSLSQMQDRFFLKPERQDIRLSRLSGERWRASAALGYVKGRKIFYAPYQTSEFYYAMCQSGLLKALRELTDSGAVVLLPVGSDDFVKHIADVCVYMKHDYDVETLRQRYQDLFQSGEWVRN